MVRTSLLRLPEEVRAVRAAAVRALPRVKAPSGAIAARVTAERSIPPCACSRSIRRPQQRRGRSSRSCCRTAPLPRAEHPLRETPHHRAGSCRAVHRYRVAEHPPSVQDPASTAPPLDLAHLAAQLQAADRPEGLRHDGVDDDDRRDDRRHGAADRVLAAASPAAASACPAAATEIAAPTAASPAAASSASAADPSAAGQADPSAGSQADPSSAEEPAAESARSVRTAAGVAEPSAASARGS